MFKESKHYRKQILLFLLVFVLPSIVLVVLSLRMIGQDRELAEKRVSDERRRITSELSQYLFARLETIKSQEISIESFSEGYKNPEVVLLGLVDGDQLKLPWEIIPSGDTERQSLYQIGFIQQIRNAEEAELVDKNFSRASQNYRQLLKTTLTNTQEGYAKLLLSRVLMKSGQIDEASSLYSNILALSSNITDEFNIPIFLYAAGRLSDNHMYLNEVTLRIKKRLDETYPISPSESYMIKDICEKLLKPISENVPAEIAGNILQKIKEYIYNIEQSLSLQRDFPTLFRDLQNEQQETVWIAYGDQPWLLSLSLSTKSVLIVVDALDVLGTLQNDKNLESFIPHDVHFVSEGTGLGEYMGSNFQGIRIAFSENQENTFIRQQGLQRSFYLLVLFLVIGVTLFGAYLLWRDVRRDLRLAEMRSQFVSSVSHELKTPLTSIRMFAETLRLRRSKDQKMQDEYLDTIVNESQRLTRLLNNVLDFSKIEKGKRTYKMELGSLPEIIRTAARAMEYPLSQQDFKLHVQIGEDIPEIRMDADAIEQALLNLISNAMKYSGDSRDIYVKLEKTDNQAVIHVIDKGIGIDPQEQKKIFDKFYRVPSPENERTAGTGLGLSLVTHIVEAHGGRLEVISKEDQGSTFSIFLPFKRDS